MNDEPMVYLNGRMVKASQASIPIYDAAVVMGATISEVTRSFGHRPFRLKAHLQRLLGNLQIAGFDIAMDEGKLMRITEELIENNAALIDPQDDLGIVHFASAGPISTYAGKPATNVPPSPTLCVHTYPLPFEQWASKHQSGQHLVTVSVRHLPPQCCNPRLKHRSRMHLYLAQQEAKNVDPDSEPLLLDLGGQVTETPKANFLMVQNGALVSPTTRNILPGISRHVVKELAEHLGIEFVERDFPLSVAMAAKEALTCSTSSCLLPVTRINAHSIGTGRPGKLFQKLIYAWSELVGVDILSQSRKGADRRTRSLATKKV